MSAPHTTNEERLHDLLADRALQLLSLDEERELRGLLETHPDVDESTYDWVAAAVDLSSAPTSDETIPAALRDRIEVDAVAWLARSRGLSVSGNASPTIRTTPMTSDEPRPATALTGGGRSWLPWVLAAACLALAAIAWWPASTRSLATQYATLRDDPSSTRFQWSAVEGFTASGDVVWNAERRSGFMRFRGLAVNDPSQLQYQLWIFDDSRKAYSENIAVDGGVFDVDQATGDVYIPIRAKLDIVEPTLFAITTEPPGGVVKHNPERDPERYRIILTAPVG